ncbi:hypothetical protein KFK09_020430 [Dendrobium nobile]|uniref:Uncharacterized protein n=1 Tax=Dendrobium nobile TaxID=94219 RepID=A0A8T3AMH2_DENNO|nr:hypothetical protein KFK09_020430 [Dendrobium nobile]
MERNVHTYPKSTNLYLNSFIPNKIYHKYVSNYHIEAFHQLASPQRLGKEYYRTKDLESIPPISQKNSTCDIMT